MTSIWSLLGLLLLISSPLLFLLLAIVGSWVPDHDRYRVPAPPPMTPPAGFPPNPARFFAGSGGIEDTLPQPHGAHGPQ
ncbi:hypothetical protein AB0D89_01330 [Streptomyces luteogriseus]|uniref:hypothetical protein n=1 Tax=Streptomyces luteogriseus TaxID=68233 RepID=UPI0033EFFF54